jgi:hypothetical protein
MKRAIILGLASTAVVATIVVLVNGIASYPPAPRSGEATRAPQTSPINTEPNTSTVVPESLLHGLVGGWKELEGNGNSWLAGHESPVSDQLVT